METASLTPTDEARLRSCYRRLLRRVLNIKTTYYTKKLDPTVPTVRNEDFDPKDRLVTALRRQRARLAARILALPQDHHVRTVTLTDSLTYRQLHSLPNRSGRPRRTWHEAAFTDLWEATYEDVERVRRHLHSQPPDSLPQQPTPQPVTHRPYSYPAGLLGLHRVVAALGCKAVERCVDRGF